MKFLSSLFTGFAVATTIKASSLARHDFRPESAASVWNNDIPILYTLNDTVPNDYGGSWWTSSFITGTNGVQYFVVSHILSISSSVAVSRASILELKTLEYNSFVTLGSAVNNATNLNASISGNGFESLSDDNLSQLRTYSTEANVTFDITWNATSYAIIDGGVGTFVFGPGTASEWGLPACATEGTLVVDNQTIEIDPTNSFTWFDRQWTTGSPGNWTWFELHLPGTEYKLSVWAIDSTVPSEVSRFGSIRTEDGAQLVVPITWTPNYTRTYYSTGTKNTYPLDWSLEVGSYGSLSISSITADQEMVGSSALVSAYEGFVTFNGDFAGVPVDGYGVVEIVYT